jgi:hypothetical protein
MRLNVVNAERTSAGRLAVRSASRVKAVAFEPVPSRLEVGFWLVVIILATLVIFVTALQYALPPPPPPVGWNARAMHELPGRDHRLELVGGRLEAECRTRG